MTQKKISLRSAAQAARLPNVFGENPTPEPILETISEAPESNLDSTPITYNQTEETLSENDIVKNNEFLQVSDLKKLNKTEKAVPFRLYESSHTKLKVLSLITGISLTDIIDQVLCDFLQKNNKTINKLKSKM